VSGCLEVKGWAGNASVGAEIWSNPYGITAADLNEPTESVDWFFHSDYCCQRPTIVRLYVGYSTATVGTSRVYVESRQDRSAYVWAEVSIAQIDFPEFEELNHLVLVSSGTVPGPVFAPDYRSGALIGSGFVSPLIQTGLLSRTGPVNLGLVDDDSYIMQPWPHLLPAIVGVDDIEIQKYVGSDCRIRAGYRENEVDTTLFEITGAGGLEGSLELGCFWPDLEFGRDEIRCGIRATNDEAPVQQIFGTVNSSYSLPFIVPRDVFESEPGVLASPVYVGGSVEYDPTATVDLGFWLSPSDFVEPSTGPPAPPSTQFDTATSASANFSETLPDGGSLEPVGYVSPLRWCSKDGPTGPVTDAEPETVARPDRQLFPNNAIYSGPSWHARDIVRQGSPLAIPGSLHQLEVTFSDEPDLQDVAFQNVIFPLLGEQGTRIIPVVYPHLRGSYTLTPFSPAGVRLAPNRFHCFSEQPDPALVFTHDPPDTVSDGGGTLTEAEYAERAKVPLSSADYRADYTQESFVQMWATTSVGLNFRNRGPLEIPLPESGMATQDYDQFIRRRSGATNQDMVSPTWVVYDYEQLVIELSIRLRVKLTVENVVGYGFFSEKGDEVLSGGESFDPPRFFYTAIEEIAQKFTSAGPSVLCNEVLMVKRMILDREQMASLSQGEEVTVPAFTDFPFGFSGLDAGPGVFGDVTIKASVYENEP
jgi:hypothetical protein